MRSKSRFPICSAILLSFLSAPAWAQPSEPDSSPILRIEMGGHTDYVNGSAIDAGGRWLVTASDDRTARLWEIGSGRLLTVFRPPSSGLVGKLYAAAISDDGERIVVGGATDENWFGGNAAVVFDRQGRMVRVLDGIRGEIKDIALSPDNRMLAIGSAGGVQLFDFADYRRLALVTDRAQRRMREMAISGSGSIAYVAADRGNRYSLVLCQFQQEAVSCNQEVSSKPGFFFYGLAFSPSGTELAAAERKVSGTARVADERGSAHVY